MAQYPTIYSDKNGSVITTIFNLFNEKGTDCLEMIVDGIPFTSSSFDRFSLVNPEKYSEKQLSRFSFNKIPVLDTDKFSWELCNCKLNFHIPQIIIDIENDAEIKSDLKILLQIGKPLKNGTISNIYVQLTLSFTNQKFISESADFETTLSQIQKEMMPAYRFNNCFSCHYSDYSPAGSGFFASMMCFRKNKAAYLTASQREDFFKLANDGYIAVQETYMCDEFAPREKGTGYRGWAFD
jgi:hypothetical protein